MNCEESKLSEPMSEEESQRAENAQPSVTRSELRQQSPSSQSEARNLPSFSSSGEETGASENKTEKTSSRDKKLQSREQQSSVPIHSDPSKAQSFSTKSTDISRTVLKNRFSKDKPGSEKESSTDLAKNLSEELLKTSTSKIPLNGLEVMKNESPESRKLRDCRPTPELENATSKSSCLSRNTERIIYGTKSTRTGVIPSSTKTGADYYEPELKLHEADDLKENWTPHVSYQEPEPLQEKLDPTGLYRYSYRRITV